MKTKAMFPDASKLQETKGDSRKQLENLAAKNRGSRKLISYGSTIRFSAGGFCIPYYGSGKNLFEDRRRAELGR